MLQTYTAPELARAAGYLLRRVATGGVREFDTGYGLILEIGPEATADEIVQFARRRLVWPVSCRAGDVTPAVTHRAG
jgi:hypothetical protein